MKEILNRVLAQEELTRQETKDILIGITQDRFPNEQITALLTALQMRGVTVDELLGFRDGILETWHGKVKCMEYNPEIFELEEKKNKNKNITFS